MGSNNYGVLIAGKKTADLLAKTDFTRQFAMLETTNSTEIPDLETIEYNGVPTAGQYLKSKLLTRDLYQFDSYQFVDFGNGYRGILARKMVSGQERRWYAVYENSGLVEERQARFGQMSLGDSNTLAKVRELYNTIVAQGEECDINATELINALGNAVNGVTATETGYDATLRLLGVKDGNPLNVRCGQEVGDDDEWLTITIGNRPTISSTYDNSFEAVLRFSLDGRLVARTVNDLTAAA